MNVLKFNLNDVLMVELADDSFSGQLVSHNKTGMQFRLDHVRNLNTNEAVAGTQLFYAKEVVKITSLAPAVVTPFDGGQPVDDLPQSTAVHSPSQLTSDQLTRITKGIEDATYIHQMDRTYYDAMHLLQRQDAFAVGIASDFKAGTSTVSLITMCTLDQRLFVVDVVSLGQVPKALKAMLEGDVPRKIMHNSSIAAYILGANCGVTLGGVFDTMVAHVAVNGDKSLTTIGDCLATHLRVPGTLFEADNAPDWMVRPLSAKQRTIAAQAVAFLPALYTHLLHDRMLRTFYQKCHEFVHFYATNGDDLEVAYQICSPTNGHGQPLGPVRVECDVDVEAMRRMRIAGETALDGGI